jgi:transcriptional regulator with XRE-family HTH domain
MKSFSERISLVLQHYNLQPKDLAEKCGVQRSAISHLINGRNRPSVTFLSSLSDNYPELDTRWLLHGKGAMFTSVTETTTLPADTDVTDSKPASNAMKSAVTNVTSTQSIAQPVAPENLPGVHQANEVKSKEKEIQRIIVFYNDGTFDSYNPQSNQE